MIERYDQAEISQIWTDQYKFALFLKVELALMQAQEEAGLIPSGIRQAVKERARIDTQRIEEIEKTTRHDVIAFCASITENLPPDISKYFHFGCTSSDIIDTALSLQIKDSLDLIIKQYKKLLLALKTKAIDYRQLPSMGRSHGMNAEPLSFGQKFLSFYAQFYRRYKELISFNEELTGQFSGAVGNYTVLTTQIEESALKNLGLAVEPVSTQVIPRDRVAKLVQINALAASSIEHLATELRHLHHSDIGEIFEGFSSGQKGSSTMPHKKNPISAENLSGLARVIRSHVSIALENINLWHERDISHSSAERLMLPDNLGLTYYALKRMTSTIENLVVNVETIKSKVVNRQHFLSSLVMHDILPQVQLSREEVYEKVQKVFFELAPDESALTKLKEIKEFEKVKFSLKETSEEAIRETFLSETQQLYQRVFDVYPSPG